MQTSQKSRRCMVGSFALCCPVDDTGSAVQDAKQVLERLFECQVYESQPSVINNGNTRKYGLYIFFEPGMFSSSKNAIPLIPPYSRSEYEQVLSNRRYTDRQISAQRRHGFGCGRMRDVLRSSPSRRRIQADGIHIGAGYPNPLQTTHIRHAGRRHDYGAGFIVRICDSYPPQLDFDTDARGFQLPTREHPAVPAGHRTNTGF